MILSVSCFASASLSLTFTPLPRLCVSLSPVWWYGLCAKQQTTWYLVMWCMQMISLSRLLILIWQRSELSGPLYIGKQICSCQLEGRGAQMLVCVRVCHQARQSGIENRWRHARERSQPRQASYKLGRWMRESVSSQHCPLPPPFSAPLPHCTTQVLVLFSRAVSFKNAIETWIKRKWGKNVLVRMGCHSR